MTPPQRIEGSWEVDPAPARGIRATVPGFIVAFGLASIVATFAPRPASGAAPA